MACKAVEWMRRNPGLELTPNAIKRRNSTSAKQFIADMGVSAIAARQVMERAVSDGLLSLENCKGSNGRVRAVYAISETE
jgi:predicted ArsR family transcriptional regulator